MRRTRVAIGGLVIPTERPWVARAPLPRARRRGKVGAVLAGDGAATAAAFAPVPGRELDDALDEISFERRVTPGRGAALATFGGSRLARLSPLTAGAMMVLAAGGPSLVVAGLTVAFVAGHRHAASAVYLVGDELVVARTPGGLEARAARDALVDVWCRPGQIYLRFRGHRGIGLLAHGAPDARAILRARRLAFYLAVPFVDAGGELPAARALPAPRG